MYYLYTDASVVPENNNYVGLSCIIVEDSIIVDKLYHKLNIKNISSNKAEEMAIKHGVNYFRKMFNDDQFCIFTDNKKAIKRFKRFPIFFVKSHHPKGDVHQKLNCLADHIARKGLKNYKNMLNKLWPI